MARARTETTEAAQEPVRQYDVLISFRDMHDNNHVYWKGDKYPRIGYTPADGRIERLQGIRNRFESPVISGE